MSTRDPNALVEELFRAADHDVTSAVGKEPGTIVRVARPREGLVRPKIVWVVWPAWPASLDEAFGELERLREEAAAERAIGMFDGNPPDGQSGAVKRGPLDVMTLRRFAFELANIEEHLAAMRSAFKRSFRYGLISRLVESEAGDRREAVGAILDWSRNAAPRDLLWILGADGSGRGSVAWAAAVKAAELFGKDLDDPRPLLMISDTLRRTGMSRLLQQQGWVHLAAYGEEDDGYSRGEDYVVVRDSVLKAPVTIAAHLSSDIRDRSTLFRLLEPSTADVVRWLGERAANWSVPLKRAASSIADLRPLLCAPPSWERWATVLSSSSGGDSMSDAEIAARLVALMTARSVRSDDDPAVDWALEDFALGRCDAARWDAGRSYGFEDLVRGLGWPTADNGRFENVLVRDYFLAHKIIADIRAGRREILTRYQFPREFVLLFLAILSPEAAAVVGEDRSRAMHAEIAAEVEREVQLALAHNLKHPIAMIRGALADVRKKPPATPRDALAEELGQIETATRYIHALVEKTTQWIQVPEGPTEPLDLAAEVAGLCTRFRRDWPHVDLAVEIAAEVRVQASPAVLQAILSSLLENAFQAVDQNGSLRRVAVRALRTGDTWRIEIADSGPGVHPDDRERIFEPRVTTKTGGRGKPRGTGMGLPIARKYAQRIGGRVWLDTEAPQTTFVLELVPAREVPDDR